LVMGQFPDGLLHTLGLAEDHTFIVLASRRLMIADSKPKHFWPVAVLVILFFWWPRTVWTLVIDLVVIALCVFLAVRAKRKS
jgi:hypothetical protein